MANALAFALCLIAFGLLLAAMGRHQSDWFGVKLPPRLSLGLRAAGFSALVAAWLAAGLNKGLAYGTIVWCGSMTVAAFVVIAVNLNRDRLRTLVKR